MKKSVGRSERGARGEERGKEEKEEEEEGEEKSSSILVTNRFDTFLSLSVRQRCRGDNRMYIYTKAPRGKRRLLVTGNNQRERI